MKKIIFTIAVVGLIGLASSCSKCNTCTGADINELNHDYCNNVYKNQVTMDAAQKACEDRGGSWAEM